MENMKQQLGLVILGLAIVRLEAACPDGWSSDIFSASSCYYYIPEDATFKDASKACRHVGGELIAPQGYQDTSSMATIIQSNDEVEQRNVWLDMMRLEGEDTWTSSNGTAIAVSWYDGYPEGDGECGVFLYSVIQMKNKRCSLKSSILCRGDANTVQPMTMTCSKLPLTETKDPIIPGTYAYLQCDQGYRLSSSGHKKAYCRKDGMWSRSLDELAICQPEACAAMNIGTDVVETTDGGEEVGVSRNFTCPPGSEFKKQKRVQDIIVECNTDGMWVDASGAHLTTIEDCVPKVVADGDDGNGESTLIASKSLSISATVILLLVVF